MKIKIKHILSLFILSLIPYLSTAQSSSISSGNKLDLSFFIGAPLLGPGSDIESNMVKCGFNIDRSESNWLSSTNRTRIYPRSTYFPSFSLDALMYFKRHSGIAFSAGMPNNFMISGYDSSLIKLKNELWSVSLAYLYHFNNRKNKFFIGSSYLIYSIEKKFDRSPNEKKEKKIHHLPAVYIGYSYDLLKYRTGFMAFKMNYFWSPEVEIGPYQVEHSTLSTQNVRVSTFNIGFVFGFRRTY